MYFHKVTTHCNKTACRVIFVVFCFAQLSTLTRAVGFVDDNQTNVNTGFGVVLLVAVAVMTDYSNTLLVRTGVACGQASLEGTCAHLLGRKGFYLACVVMFFAGFGAMLIYLVIIGDTLPPVWYAVTGGADNGGTLPSRQTAVALCATFVVLPLSLLRDMAALARSSFLSIAAAVAIALVVAARAPARSEKLSLPI